MTLYRKAPGPFLRESEPGVNIEELDIIARDIRHALLNKDFTGQPRAKLVRIAKNLEIDLARLSVKCGQAQAVMAALVALLLTAAGFSIKYLVGAAGLAVAGVLLALALIFGLVIALLKGWDATLARGAKAFDELRAHIATLPEEEPAGVRINIDRLAGESLDAVPTFLEEETAEGVVKKADR